MQVRSANPQIPVYVLEPDQLIGSRQFKLYHYEGTLPNQSELLIPHRKNHYLIVFVRRANSRQWVDTTSYVLQDNTVYFTSPNQVIVKEEVKHLWSTGVAFTGEFLSLQENASLGKLPLIQNPYNKHELFLTETDIHFVEETLYKIRMEYQRPGEWQQRMIAAYLTVLLTYLSRLYTEQFTGNDASADQQLLMKFQAKVDEYFQEWHEVSDYASMLNMSAGHLSEVVKAQSGKSAIKHIHERLVLEARRLLFHTQQSTSFQN